VALSSIDAGRSETARDHCGRRDAIYLMAGIMRATVGGTIILTDADDGAWGSGRDWA
jgi:hypothetical protein